MTESEINLDNSSNLKHRAILQALLTTDLPVNAISRKLQCTSGAIYYCIKRYLYKGFCEERNKRKRKLFPTTNIVNNRQLAVNYVG